LSILNETTIETLAISILKGLDYRYIYGPDLNSESQNSLRSNLAEPLLLPILQNAITRLNPNILLSVQQEALRQVQRVYSQDSLASNEAFHIMLTEGIKVSYQKDGSERGDLVWLIDYDNLENNDFLVVNQYTVIKDQ
jgi:type I restriction enzyme R subunit